VLAVLRPPRSPLFPYTTLFRSLGGSRESRGGSSPAPWRYAKQGTRRSVSAAQCTGSWRRSPSRTPRRRCRVAARRRRESFPAARSEEHTSELQSRENLVCRLLL